MKKWFMTDKAYDVIRIIGNIILPALATLYGTLAKIWGLPRCLSRMIWA